MNYWRKHGYALGAAFFIGYSVNDLIPEWHWDGPWWISLAPFVVLFVYWFFLLRGIKKGGRNA